MSNHGTRWQSSVVTFGPVGRVAWTLALLAVLVWFVLYTGPFAIVGLVVWLGWVLPWAVRDLWRRAPLPETELSRLRDETARAAREPEKAPHPVFTDERPPPRW